MPLYTRAGSVPAPLPHRIILADGRSRTDPATFTAPEIADAGYVAAPAKPSFDPDAEYLDWTGSDWAVESLPPPSSDEVDAERDRRIAAGFSFGGKDYQSREQDRENISGASVAALAAMMNGAQPADLRWHGGASDFAWIAADNSLTTMDAQTMFAFGQAAMAHKQAHIFAARALKDADPVPLDFTDDANWPA